ncbi:MAG: 2OG-Fe(II) oxygenase [Pseudomonadota bacterium]
MTYDIVEHQPHFIVVDNFLNQEDVRKIYHYLRGRRFEYVHSKRKIQAFKITDGHPLWSDPVLSHSWEKNTLYPTYPVGTDLDLIIKKIMDFAKAYESIIGRHEEDWIHFFIRPYLYPAGTGLNWHKDGKYRAAGAFVYYAHPEWKPDWGGELLMSDTYSYDTTEENSDTEIDLRRSDWGNTRQEELIQQRGVGHYILPKPNRFVLMKGMNFHTIKKVDQSAGANLRMTLQGFFQSPIKDE